MFYYGLLPPIVYAAGLNLQRRDFFRNFASIMLFAGMGTFVSAFAFAFGTYGLVRLGWIDESLLGPTALLDCLIYGVLISAIDPVATLSVFGDLGVPPLLHNLVFGESVLNDAVCIVLFRAIRRFYMVEFHPGLVPAIILHFFKIAATSCVIGVVMGLACAYTLRRLQLDLQPPSMSEGRGRADFDVSPYALSILVLSAYMAYLVAEWAEMSGIMALFFTGIVHAHYGIKNITHEAEGAVRQGFETGAFLAESFVFAYLGMQVSTRQHEVDLGLLLSAIPLILLTRALNIFPLATLANSFRRYAIPLNVQVMQWACGLRGAIAYALCLNMPSIRSDKPGNPAVETATLFTVVFTTLFLGSATSPLLSLLNLKTDSENFEESLRTSLLEAQSQAAANRERGKVHQAFRELDDRFLKPIFGGAPSSVLAVDSPRSEPPGADDITPASFARPHDMFGGARSNPESQRDREEG